MCVESIAGGSHTADQHTLKTNSRPPFTGLVTVCGRRTITCVCMWGYVSLYGTTITGDGPKRSDRTGVPRQGPAPRLVVGPGGVAANLGPENFSSSLCDAHTVYNDLAPRTTTGSDGRRAGAANLIASADTVRTHEQSANDNGHATTIQNATDVSSATGTTCPVHV